MEEYLVRDLMTPISDYPTIAATASLLEAVAALQEAGPDANFTHYRPRALLVKDDNGKAVGKVGQLDVLRALEPRYQHLSEHAGISQFGFSGDFIRLSLEEYSLWDSPLEHVCEKVVHRQVQEFMHTPSPGEYVTEDTSLDAAIHQLIVGKHQSLIVTEEGNGTISGILLLSRVFVGVFQLIQDKCPYGDPR